MKKVVNVRWKSVEIELKNRVNVKMTYLGFGATMGEMADRAETLTLKQKPGEEMEGKSILTMTAGSLEKTEEKKPFQRERAVVSLPKSNQKKGQNIWIRWMRLQH